MKIKTSKGKELLLDEGQWLISKSPLCRVIAESETHIQIKNQNGLNCSLSKSLLRDNGIQLSNGHVELSEGLYEEQLLKPEQIRSEQALNSLFNRKVTDIFSNRHDLPQRAEYFLLRPKLLFSGGTLIGGFSYPLGALLEAWEEEEDLFFEEINGHQSLYLISTVGSPLSGRHTAVFWSETEKKVISLSNQLNEGATNGFAKGVNILKRCLEDKYKQHIDFQDHALEQMLNEMQGAGLIKGSV